MKNSTIKNWKRITITAATLLSVSAAQALPTYEFSHTPAPSSIMNDYTTTWNPNTQSLGITSSWDLSAGIDKISFLISDGGSPWLTTSEQFLWYDIDLSEGTLSIKNYFGLRAELQSFDISADITPNSIDLSIDHSYINSLTAADFPGFSGYNGAGFSTDIGIWYYMYRNGQRVETLDIHHGTPTAQVPEPTMFWLIFMGLLAAAGLRQMKQQQSSVFPIAA